MAHGATSQENETGVAAPAPGAIRTMATTQTRLADKEAPDDDHHDFPLDDAYTARCHERGIGDFRGFDPDAEGSA